MLHVISMNTIVEIQVTKLLTWNHGRPQKFFQGGNTDILLTTSRLLTMQSKCSFANRFTLSTPQRNTPCHGNSHKNAFLWQRDILR